MAQSGAVRALQLELKKIQEEPVEGFTVTLSDDDNIFEWKVAIFGPPGTLYEGGYFKVFMPNECGINGSFVFSVHRCDLDVPAAIILSFLPPFFPSFCSFHCLFLFHQQDPTLLTYCLLFRLWLSLFSNQWALSVSPSFVSLMVPFRGCHGLTNSFLFRSGVAENLMNHHFLLLQFPVIGFGISRVFGDHGR